MSAAAEPLAASPALPGPFLGLPVMRQELPMSSASTFPAAQSRRATPNADNQTPAPWLAARNQRLAVDDPLALLRLNG